MKTTKCIIIILLFTFFAAGYVLAQELVIYPAKGQSQEQMDKDKYECYSWAKQQSGFDPMQQPKATEPPKYGIDYTSSQLPPSDDYLYVDVEYQDTFSS